MFEKGDYVVYGTKGVCQVEEITELAMKGTAEGKLYYVLRPCFQKGSTLFTPVDNEKTIIRPVMSRDEAAALVDGIAGIEALLEKNDKEREKQYMSRARKYSREEMEAFAQMFAEVTLELDRNPDQDFLGDLFMSLDLASLASDPTAFVIPIAPFSYFKCLFRYRYECYRDL